MSKVMLMLVVCLLPTLAFGAEEGIKIYGIELAQILELAFMVAGFIASLFGINWVRIKNGSAALIKAKVKDERLQTLLLNINDCALPIVKNIYEESVRGLKEKAKDGKLTKKEIKSVTALAVARLKEASGSMIFDLIGMTKLGESGLNDLLAGVIRKAVTRSKKDKLPARVPKKKGK